MASDPFLGRKRLRASVDSTIELIKRPVADESANEPQINLQEELDTNINSLQLKEHPTEGWISIKEKLLKIQKPELKKPEPKPEIKRIHGFRLYKTPGEDKLSLQIGMNPNTKGAQVLISAVQSFISRVTGREVEIGKIEGWECPCSDLEDHFQDVSQIALLLSYPDYTSPKVGHEWFLKELFNMAHAKMEGKNYEVAVPKGIGLTSWLLRDIVRLFGAFRYEVLRQFILRIPIKERQGMKIRFHDFEKFKSVLSEREWSIIIGSTLDDRIAECKVVKASLVQYKEYDYRKFRESNAEIAVDKFGKAALSLIYQRINERNALRAAAIKRKANPSVPLRVVLQSLLGKHLYSGVHLLPAILKYRPGDLPIIQKITKVDDSGITANDSRFGNIENYLRYAQDHPTDAADASRVVEISLDRDFPMLGDN